MLNFLKRLNWYGFIVVFSLCLAAAMGREQDPSIQVSLVIGSILGAFFGIIFLFAGMKDKE